jgi:hypothetical protein
MWRYTHSLCAERHRYRIRKRLPEIKSSRFPHFLLEGLEGADRFIMAVNQVPGFVVEVGDGQNIRIGGDSAFIKAGHGGVVFEEPA